MVVQIQGPIISDELMQVNFAPPGGADRPSIEIGWAAVVTIDLFGEA
jgi:hypothetical protein